MWYDAKSQSDAGQQDGPNADGMCVCVCNNSITAQGVSEGPRARAAEAVRALRMS